MEVRAVCTVHDTQHGAASPNVSRRFARRRRRPVCRRALSLIAQHLHPAPSHQMAAAAPTAPPHAQAPNGGGAANANDGGSGADDDAPLLDLLERFWGYRSFRPPQAAAIRAALEGRDALVVVATGGGKSLCYQVAALAMGKPVFVVSPLISLMHDQVDALNARGVAAAFLGSAQASGEVRCFGCCVPRAWLHAMRPHACRAFARLVEELSGVWFEVGQCGLRMRMRCGVCARAPTFLAHTPPSNNNDLTHTCIPMTYAAPHIHTHMHNMYMHTHTQTYTGQGARVGGRVPFSLPDSRARDQRNRRAAGAARAPRRRPHRRRRGALVRRRRRCGGAYKGESISSTGGLSVCREAGGHCNTMCTLHLHTICICTTPSAHLHHTIWISAASPSTATTSARRSASSRCCATRCPTCRSWR